MKKLYCYLETDDGYAVFEYTQNGRFEFYGKYKNETEANEIICKLSV